MRKVYCDYCGRQAEYVDSKVVYGKSYGMMYLCRNCMAYVGVHKGTDKPLGRLAQKMGLPVEQTHIGMFDVAQCRKAIHIIENETRGGSSHG